MAVKMNLRIITKNHATDPEIGFLTKSISEPNGCETAMPTAWELQLLLNFLTDYSECGIDSSKQFSSHSLEICGKSPRKFFEILESPDFR